MKTRLNWLKVGKGVTAVGLLLALAGCVSEETTPKVVFDPADAVAMTPSPIIATAPPRIEDQPLLTRTPYAGPKFSAETLTLIDQGHILQELGEAVFFEDWTPDGQIMVYVDTGEPVANADEYPETMKPPTVKQVWQANVDGTDARQTSLPVGGRWSPDRKKLAYRTSDAQGHRYWGIVDLTTNMRQIVLTDTLSLLDWLNNDTILFANEEGKLELVEANGRNRRPFVVPEIEDEWHAGFRLSPDKRRITIAESRRISRRVWLGELSGERIHHFQVLGEGIGPVDWSPDSSKVVYSLEYTETIEIVNVRGQKLAQVAIPEGLEYRGGASWSPDSNLLLFMAGPFQQSQSYWYMCNADGTGLQKLWGPIGDISIPRWSPDGRYLIYSEIDPWNAPATLDELSKVHVWRVGR